LEISTGKVLPSFKNEKRRHYWIYSVVPNLGKTFYFAKPLSSKYGAYIETGDFTYWNVKDTEQVIILDEYNGAHLKWHQLNAICDGTFFYRRFMGV